MVDEVRPQLQYLLDGDEATAESSAPRLCDQCGARADWTITDRTGVAQGFICVPCHEAHRRHRNRWDRRVRRQLRHAVRRS